MAEFPAMPLWTDAYLGDTSHLTTFEHGAYLLLLIVAWRSKGCRLPNDPTLLARYARCTKGQWTKIAPTIMGFFTTDAEGFLVQKRLQHEQCKVRSHRQSQSIKGQASALKRKENSSTVVAERLVLPTPTPTPEKEREAKASTKKAGPTRWKGGSPIPEEWITWAVKEEGWPERRARSEAARFTDYSMANGKAYTSWSAAWRNWCRSPYQKKDQSGGHNQAALTL